MMFKKNKYHKMYYNIIDTASQRPITGYVERHHIIPKSLGGTDDATNLVALTAREHFICHLLLIRMVDGIDRSKMVYAAWQQSRPSKYKSVKVTSRTYETLRQQMSESYTGRTRQPFSDEWKANMKESAKTRKKVEYTQERLAQLAAIRPRMAGWNKGIKMDLTDDQRVLISQKFSLANKGKPKPRITCPHCGVDVAVNTYPRWHGDNCKSIQPSTHS